MHQVEKADSKVKSGDFNWLGDKQSLKIGKEVRIEEVMVRKEELRSGNLEGCLELHNRI